MGALAYVAGAVVGAAVASKLESWSLLPAALLVCLNLQPWS